MIYPGSPEKESWMKWIDKSLGTSNRDNISKIGFSIERIKGKTNSSNSYYKSPKKVVRITTPDGWELEIELRNLVELIHTCTIINGEIQDKCFWIWINGKKWLLSENNKDKKYKGLF